MSDTNAPEPTMEEILASIRRIISEDEPAAAEAPAAAPAALHVVEPEPAPHVEPEPEPVAEHEDILELTDPVVEAPPAVETHGDIEVSPALAPAPPPGLDDGSQVGLHWLAVDGARRGLGANDQR